MKIFFLALSISCFASAKHDYLRRLTGNSQKGGHPFVLNLVSNSSLGLGLVPPTPEEGGVITRNVCIDPIYQVNVTYDSDMHLKAHIVDGNTQGVDCCMRVHNKGIDCESCDKNNKEENKWMFAQLFGEQPNNLLLIGFENQKNTHEAKVVEYDAEAPGNFFVNLGSLEVSKKRGEEDLSQHLFTLGDDYTQFFQEAASPKRQTKRKTKGERRLSQRGKEAKLELPGQRDVKLGLYLPQLQAPGSLLELNHHAYLGNDTTKHVEFIYDSKLHLMSKDVDPECCLKLVMVKDGNDKNDEPKIVCEDCKKDTLQEQCLFVEPFATDKYKGKDNEKDAELKLVMLDEDGEAWVVRYDPSVMGSQIQLVKFVEASPDNDNEVFYIQDQKRFFGF